jgi:hypothetical protein
MNLAGSNTSITVSQSALYSYWNNMNSGGTTPGTFGGYLQNTAEANLAALATVGYVDQVLYYYGANPDGGTPGVQVGVLRTFADGSTMLNPMNDPGASVPVPAAAYLFGSGLLGLIGLRRKMAA